MLALKLFLVPAFLLAVSLAGRRWGPAVAGWLAGMPVVAGPILFVLAIKQGPHFAASAASAALAAVCALVIYGVVYANFARHMIRLPALLLGWTAWFATAGCLSLLPASIPLSLAVALATLLLAPRCFPPADFQSSAHRIGSLELACRMVAGALLTLAVAGLADIVGERWSGLLAVFPVMGTVLAVFAHRGQGAGQAAAVLRGMVTGLYSFSAFCVVLALGLPSLGTAGAFMAASAAAGVIQLRSRRHMIKAAAQASRR